MNEQAFFNSLLIGWFVLAALMFLTLFFVVAPYGRHTRSGWGPVLNTKMGWIVMEAMAPLVFATCFILGDNSNTISALVFLGLWELHYLHRAFIYPFSLRAGARRMTLIVMTSGLLFNTVNSYLNGRYLFTFSATYTNQWLADPRFIAGVAVFLVGFVVNRGADHTLRNLRQVGECGYKIPHGHLYRWISCPNYLGEVITWIGWAVATWSLPGLAFALWTVANLVPRARANHAWYRKHFPDYPPHRKALLPGLW